jgi:endonuclease V-like protein UPF0215 family
MKDQARILGIDDSKFTFEDEFCHVVGVVMRADGYLEGVMVDKVGVDGDDANRVLALMINKSRYKKQLRLILTDGIALGGFNIIDLEKLNRDTDIPVAAVTRNEPDFEEMKKALKHHFKDWQSRFDIICKGEIFTVPTEHKPLHVKGFGMDQQELYLSVKKSIHRGALPEPIRIAHIIATALVSGESKGRA